MEEQPPTDYFYGITYNPSFFISSDGLSLGVANALYLRKKTADTATALETFSGGISSTTIQAYNYDAVSPLSTITIGAGQTGVGGGALSIGANANRTGPIYIGNNTVPIDMRGPMSLTSSSTFTLGAGQTGTISGGLLNLMSPAGLINMTSYSGMAIDNIGYGNLNIGTTATTGPINIGIGARNQNINIGTGATGGILTLGSASMPLSILGTFTLPSVGTTGSISGASFANTAGSASISSTGVITGASFANTAGSASISSTGAITGASLSVGTGTITSGGITASGLLTANLGITVPSGQTIASNGTLTSNKLDALTTNGAQTIGGNITDGSITIGGALTTGDINIGTISTSDIYIGNSTSSTTGTNVGVCHINKCQIGSGSTFRSILFGTVSGGSGSATVSFGQTLPSTPLMVGTLIASNLAQVYSLTIVATTTGFTYYKNYIAFSGTTITGSGGASGESFNWVAYCV